MNCIQEWSALLGSFLLFSSRHREQRPGPRRAAGARRTRRGRAPVGQQALGALARLRARATLQRSEGVCKEA